MSPVDDKAGRRGAGSSVVCFCTCRGCRPFLSDGEAPGFTNGGAFSVWSRREGEKRDTNVMI